MAPRSLLTPELSKRICDYAAEGRGLGWIAAQCKIAENTLRTWLTRGRKNPDGKHGEFAARYDRAQDNPRAYQAEVLTGGPVPEGMAPTKRGGHKGPLANVAKLPRSAARVTELTPEVHASIVAALKRGNYLDVAAAQCGVTGRIVLGWMKRGAEQEDGPFVEFAREVMQANAGAENDLLDRMWSLTSCGDAKAAVSATQFLLERRFGGHWAERMNRDARQTIAQILATVEEHVSPDQYAAILGSLGRIGGGAIAEAVTGAVAGHLPVAE